MQLLVAKSGAKHQTCTHIVHPPGAAKRAGADSPSTQSGPQRQGHSSANRKLLDKQAHFPHVHAGSSSASPSRCLSSPSLDKQGRITQYIELTTCVPKPQAGQRLKWHAAYKENNNAMHTSTTEHRGQAVHIIN